WFIFNKGKLLTKIEEGNYHIPQTSDLEQSVLSPIRKTYFGTYDRYLCYAAELDQSVLAANGFEFKDLRSLFDLIDEDLIWIASRANHLVYWSKAHKYCGRCGHRTRDKSDERAKICPQCGLISYPRLSPAVIVAVRKENQILLARNKRFKIPIYSVLAGFVEPGETLEECVEREVLEEVGITVKNIRYFGSQSWLFPDSLMLGFVAEYAKGDITADGLEIIDAAWFSKDNLPLIPPKISIARHLIDSFVENQY
ncbi:MAG: NAD(+) diphosphatase, partial [Desulfobacterales bacterium]